jgi:hypothetical protein
MFATLAEPETAYHRYTSHATLARETKALEVGVRSGANDATVGTASGGIVHFPTIGEESQLARADIPISSSGFNADLYADVLFYRVGRGIGFLAGLNAFDPFPQAQFLHIARKLAARGTAAQPTPAQASRRSGPPPSAVAGGVIPADERVGRSRR